MNRRSLIAAAPLALLAVSAPGFAQELRDRTPGGPEIVVLAGESRAAAIAAANRSLNAVQRMQGRFTQVAPGGGRSTGRFYMQRPGRMRFEYDPPATLLIVSDGNTVSMRDSAMRTTDRTSLRSTPLHLILGARIDLERQARITRVSRSGPWTMITVRDRSGRAEGYITLQFYGANAELRSWDVTDASGGRTRVTLSDVSQPASLDGGLFRLEDMLEDRRRRRR